tara:strand:- start:275 stop:976 length:702 start_codon:yes stop_codon:yes gene_type:complete
MEKKYVLVTGASKGIGREICENLSKFKNFQVYGVGRSKIKINNFNYFALDISKQNNLKLLSKKIPKLDVLINNAGIARTKYKSKIKNFSKIIDFNLKIPYIVSDSFLDKIKKSEIKSIINICSINAYQAFPENPGYVASKGGLRMLTKSMALDYRKYQIRVNSVSPGYILTDMTINSYKNKKKYKERSNRTILQRWGKTTDIVGVIKFLISQDSSYITGEDIVVDGGWIAKGL